MKNMPVGTGVPTVYGFPVSRKPSPMQEKVSSEREMDEVEIQRLCLHIRRGRRPRLPAKSRISAIIYPWVVATPDPRVTFGVKSHQKRRGPENL